MVLEEFDMSKVVYVDKLNNTKIFAERAEYTRAGINIDSSLNSKLEKLSGATSGNLAAFDSSGSLVDSNQSAANLVHDASYVHTDNNYTTSEKTKLGTIETSAQVNVIETISVNGSEQTVTGKGVNIPVPTGGSTNPNQDGTASPGSASTYSRSDHTHPTDTSREAVANRDNAITSSPISGHYPSTEAVANFVNSSIATNTAHFLGSFTLTDLGLTYPASNSQIETALDAHSWPSGTTPTNNDYVYVEIQNPETTGVDDMVKRFKFDGTSWAYEYTLNNSSFTSQEKAALESGITSGAVSSYNAHLGATVTTVRPTSAASDDKFPTEKAVRSAIDGFVNTTDERYVRFDDFQNLSPSNKYQARSNIDAEDVDRKVSSWSSTPNNTRYPSEKLVKDSIDAINVNNMPLVQGNNVTLTSGASGLVVDINVISNSFIDSLFT